MRLISISARNYRTLHDINIPFEKDYCTISGRNNAGKSCVIRLLQNLFRKNPSVPWRYNEYSFDYKEDKSQWHKEDEPIEIAYALELTKSDDPALITFIEKITNVIIKRDPVTLRIEQSINSTDQVKSKVTVDSQGADEPSSKEIVKKLNDSNLLFLYNSTSRHEEIYYGRGKARMFYEIVMSKDDRKALDEAAKKTERSVKQLAKKNKEDLNNILGRLSEKYDVEFSPMEGFSTRHMPLGINLKDKSVEVPLDDWGSGTQNRTHVLMAVLQANRIKTTDSAEDKITPIVVVEEPESFLHPSAQAEFGKVLRTLSTDLGIQIIATTHSPYMLNQDSPSSNILLCRQCKRGKHLDAKVVDTSGDNWMAPFAEHLGIDPQEFNSWRPVFSSYRSRVLLVEGPTDKEYFEFLQKNKLSVDQLDNGIEVVPYEGKDTLKNTLLVKFVLSKLDRVFITYDYDADSEIKGFLKRLGLKEGHDFLALGVHLPGRTAIEGLLPNRILDAVNGRETALVMQLGSRESKERKEAKDKLKKKYLEEFKKQTSYSKEELKELSKAVKIINDRLSKENKWRHSSKME